MTQRRGKPKAASAPVLTDTQSEQAQAEQVVLEKANTDTQQPPESQNDQADASQDQLPDPDQPEPSSTDPVDQSDTDTQSEQVQADQVVIKADPLLIRVSSKLVYDVYEPASRVTLKASAVTEITCKNKRHKAMIVSNLKQLSHGKNTLEVLDA